MNAKVKAIEEIADKHIFRINQALDKLKDTFPISEQLITNLSVEQIFSIEMLTSRFAKLQDHLGANVIDLFFELNNENSDQLTMIDKLNKLEKLRIIEDSHLWREMRKARNISHGAPAEREACRLGAVSKTAIYSDFNQGSKATVFACAV